MTAIHRLSKLFQPMTNASKNSNLPKKDFMSKSQRLMLELGIIHQAVPGCFHFLPMGLKSLDKLTKMVREEMQAIGGQEVMFPTLVKAELWKKSGRMNDMGPELITLQDRHEQKYILGPTHEETVSHLLSTLPPMSYNKFPLLIYQITSKFRDEMKPRFGLIRGREFLMKDMYSFDVDENKALATYEKVCQSYERVLERIGIDFAKVVGTSGTMGGHLSHEYHYVADIGDDKIFMCNKCNYASNMELINDRKCQSCGETKDIKVQSAIEVGHTFLLGNKYSKPLGATYLDEHNKPHVLQMGCYGIGISRLLAASLECLSSDQELRWPDSIAPYNVVVIPPKQGSKEEAQIPELGENLYNSLENSLPNLKGNILLDDRTNLTIGRRLIDSKRTGIRYLIVLNKRSCERPAVFEVNDIVKNKQFYLCESDLVTFLAGRGDIRQQERKAG